MPAESQAQEPAPPAAAPYTGDLADWVRLADEMIAAGEALSRVAQADAESGPQLAGLALLARSIGHMQAVVLLIHAERIVEARTITRNLIENLFLAVALSEDGETTFKELEADFRASRLKRGKLIAENTGTFSPEQIAQVEAHMEKLAKGRMLKPSDVAKRTSVQEAYLFYAQLSGDSAHPSLDALERHLVKGEAGRLVELSLEPVIDPEEPRDTVGWACMALLGTLVAVRDLTGGTEASPQINAAGDGYLRLTRGMSGDAR